MRKEYVDGVEVQPLVIEHDRELGDHRGGVVVLAGVKVDLTGRHQGSLVLMPGAQVNINSEHQGSVRVEGSARLCVYGAQQGSNYVAVGGVLEVAERGRLQGSIDNQGLITNAGSRGGSEHGSGTILDLPGSRVVKPVNKDGVTFYEW